MTAKAGSCSGRASHQSKISRMMLKNDSLNQDTANCNVAGTLFRRNLGMPASAGTTG